ncbi:MAG: M23 family metallopeptidase [Pseudomonadota bacterium]
MRRPILLLALGTAIAAAPALADRMPLSGGDLAPGERYSTFVHAAGIQAEGHDIGLVRWISDSNWSKLKAGKTDTKILSNWLVYRRPVYAMAAGTVVGCWRNAPENTPGSLHASYVANKFAGGGNHLWILQDNGVYALYAHMRPGSIPASICPNNAVLFAGTKMYAGNPDIDPSVKVTGGAHIGEGQKIGEIGNSGASAGGPHLHVHMEMGGNPVAMKFAHGMSTPFPNGVASINGPWTLLKGKALPAATILFWPPRPAGNYTFKGTEDEGFQGLFDHLSDSGMMPDLIWCADNGQIYNSTWVPVKGSWQSRFGMTAAEATERHAHFTGLGYKRTSSFTCGDFQAAVWRK